MKFEDWLFVTEVFNEISDVFSADISQVNLHRTGVGYTYDFYVDGIRYTAMFVYDDLAGSEVVNLPDVDLTGYEVMFMGPKGLSSSNQAGTSATAVYSQLLMAVRALIEQTQKTDHPAQFLRFSPAEPKMALLYNRFYQRYLSQSYKMVARNLYVDKSVLQAHMDSMPTGAQNLLYKGHEQAQQDHAADLHNIKLNQKKDVQMRRMAGPTIAPTPSAPPRTKKWG